MPTYEYKCLNCGDLFEVFQSMKDEPIKKCPKCGSEVKRLIGTGAGTIFKGTGFYQTDYKNSSKTTDKKETQKENTKSSSTKSGSSSKLATDNK